jgi:tetratricopeptide (TPR) repeat protein
MQKWLFLLLMMLSPLFWRGVGGEAFAQNPKIDSLLTLLKTDKEDTNKVKHLYKVCDLYRLVGNYDKGMANGKQALALAQNLNFKKGIAESYNNIGVIYYSQGNYPEALKNYFAALKIREEIGNKNSIATSYNNIGVIYYSQGNYPEALKNYLATLKINEEIGYKYGIASSYINIGGIYFSQGNYSEALKNYFACLKIFEEIKDKQGIAYSYQGIGISYCSQRNYTEALKNHFASLKINEEIGDKNSIASCFINLGTLYTTIKKTKEAQDYLNKALDLSKEIGSNDAIKDSYSGLAVLDSTMGNYKAAFEHHKLYILYRDSLNNEETKKKSLQNAMQYEFDKKEIATKAEQDKLDAINAEEKKKQQIVIYAVAGLLILVGVFAVFMYNRFRITQKQKAVIEEQKVLVDKAYETLHEKNKEVMDSIRYAKRIQTALITSEKYITNSLNRLMKN